MVRKVCFATQSIPLMAPDTRAAAEVGAELVMIASEYKYVSCTAAAAPTAPRTALLPNRDVHIPLVCSAMSAHQHVAAPLPLQAIAQPMAFPSSRASIRIWGTSSLGEQSY